MKYTLEDVQEAIKYAWSIGRLNYLFRRSQWEIKQAWIKSKQKSRKFYIECTRRLGKSSFLLLLFTEECLSSPNRKCGFFAPVKDGLLDYIEPLIRKTFESCPQSLLPTFDKQRFMLRFKNGSTIIFRGSNNQQHRIRRGQEFHAAGIDEARDVDDLDDLIDSVVFPALFDDNGYLLVSSTPADSRSHPLFELRQRAFTEGWGISLPIWEANRLDPETYPMDRILEWKKETLAGIDGDEKWETEYECKWVVSKRKLCVPEWDTRSMVGLQGKDAYYPFYHHYVGIDWGYKDFTAIIFGTYNFRKARLEIDGELTYSGKDVRSDLIAEAIRREQTHLWGKDPLIWRHVSDCADPILITELNKYHGMSFVPVEKAHTLDAMMNEFRCLVASGKLLVSPKCQMLIHCLENAIWEDENKRNKLTQDAFAHHFDHLMALVYMTRVLDTSTNPIPRDYMIDNVRVTEINFDKMPTKMGSAKALQDAFGKKRFAA